MPKKKAQNPDEQSDKILRFTKTPANEPFEPVEPDDDEDSGPPSVYEIERLEWMLEDLSLRHTVESGADPIATLEQARAAGTLDEYYDHDQFMRERMAQELAYCAFEADEAAYAVSMCMAALELDPDCTDAATQLAIHASKSAKECLPRLRAVVADAEEILGEEYMSANRGRFWAVLDTRPYMRAKQLLVSTLVRVKRLPEAIRHAEEMLLLNLDDDQSMRTFVLALNLQLGNLEGAASVFTRYPLDTSAVFKWGRILERFLAGDLETAEKLFRQAHKNNKRVQAHLLKKSKTPRRLPSPGTPQNEAEAAQCAYVLSSAWDAYPEAVKWLRSLAGK